MGTGVDGMFTLFLRGAVLYAAMILVMRGLGKRQLGEFQPFELAMTILLADVISAPMESVSVPLLNGLLPVAAMFVVHSLVSALSARFDGVRAVVSGKPTVVIQRGVVDRDALDKLCLSLRDYCEAFDPMKYYEIHQEAEIDENIGVRMVMKLAKDIRYINTFNSNCLFIYLEV